MTGTRKQLGVLAVILLFLAAAQVLSVVLIPPEVVVGPGPDAASLRSAPAWRFGVVIAVSFVLDGALGLAGYWCARKIDLPGIFRPGSSWQTNLLYPSLIGLGLGLVIAIVYLVLVGPDTTSGSYSLGLVTSIVVAAGTAIPGEVIYSLVAISALSWLAITLSRGRWRSGWITGFWVLAAIVYSLTAFSVLVDRLDAVPHDAAILFAINLAIALVASRKFIQDGLVASVGVRFWSLFVWHITVGLWSVTR